jgi:hypothetical protein
VVGRGGGGDGEFKLLDLVQGLFPPINLKEQTSSLMCFHFLIRKSLFLYIFHTSCI